MFDIYLFSFSSVVDVINDVHYNKNEHKIKKRRIFSFFFVYCSRMSRKRRTAERTAAAVDVE